MRRDARPDALGAAPPLCIDCERSNGSACPRHPVRKEKLWSGVELRAAYECGKEEGFDESARICDYMAEPVDLCGLTYGLRPQEQLDAMHDMAKHIAKLIRARGAA